MNDQISILGDADLDIVNGGGLDGFTHYPTATTASGGPANYGPNADFTKGNTKGLSGTDLGSSR